MTASPRPVELSLRMVTILFLSFLTDASTYEARTRASKKSERRLSWKRMVIDCLDGGLIERRRQQKTLANEYHFDRGNV